MEKRLFFLFLTLFLAVCAGLLAQSADYMPHVSQLKAESRGNFIRLTWIDSPDARGAVYIFRSARPFGASVPPNSRPVVVRYGEQYYIDDTEDIVNIYYFIAASDTSGRRFDIIIPQINSTNVNLASPPVIQPSAPVTAIASPQKEVKPMPSTPTGITNIRAIHEGDRVIISFDVSDKRKTVILYRSMQPLRQPADLVNAVIVQSGIISPFVDYPVPGLPWYYAVIYEDEISGGNMGITIGLNSTHSAVLISIEGIIEKPLRPIPLPAMSGRTLSENYFLTDTTGFYSMSAQTEQMIRNTQLPPKAPLSLKNPRVFAVDLQAPTSGEESALFQIVKEYFEKRDWEGARTSFLHYLSLPRSKEAETRARFYLGQTLYFTGNYKGALFEFLSIKSVHPVEANIWIDAILTAMVY